MKQLESALRSAGYLPSNEIRSERDRAIGALVRARKAKRKGAKTLKARVLALVSALKVPAPIGALVVLFVVLAMPSVAFAHPGHDDHGMPSGQAGVVLVGVTLGLASLAWQMWGERRRALVASVEGEAPVAGGPVPEHQPEHPELAPYYTVKIPYTLVGQTQWHPTEATGPFAVLTRGCHRSLDAARAWADSHLGATTYSVVLVTYDYVAGEDKLETVFATEGK